MLKLVVSTYYLFKLLGQKLNHTFIYVWRIELRYSVYPNEKWISTNTVLEFYDAKFSCNIPCFVLQINYLLL